MRTWYTSIFGLVIASALAVSSAATASTLVGDDVDWITSFPTDGDVLATGNVTVAADDSDTFAFGFGGRLQVDINATSVTMDYVADFSTLYPSGSGPNACNCLLLSGLDFDDGASITGVSLSGTGAGFVAFTVGDEVVFGDDFLRIDVGGALLDTGDQLTVSFQTSMAPVPLPAAFPLLLTAIGGLGFAARRRKAA